MKKLILAALAATVVATPVMAAPQNNDQGRGRIEQRHDQRGDRNDRGDQRGDRGDRFDHRGDRGDRGQRYGYRNDRHGDRFEHRRWNRGDRFDYRYARNYRVIRNPGHYHLGYAPRGYRWVQSGSDAVLVGITTGIIASVIANSIN
jgi:Ni/Co efflux regulator RcnB